MALGAVNCINSSYGTTAKAGFPSFLIALDSFALFQKLKVCISGHFGSSHIAPDYFSVYFSVGRDNNRPADSCFNIGAVVSLLPVKNITSFLEDALKGFPVDGS